MNRPLRIGATCLIGSILLFSTHSEPSYADDFFDKVKEAAEEVQKRRQQQQQQQSGQQAQPQKPQPQPRASQPVPAQRQPEQPTSPSPQPARQAAAQPNYDPPQPSADFGTPQATAEIAAKAGVLDVVGIKLGMPLNAALDAVKVACQTPRSVTTPSAIACGVPDNVRFFRSKDCARSFPSLTKNRFPEA